MIRNTTLGYGWLSIILHWLGAIGVLGLFSVGFFMVDLDYYDPLYKVLPHWHKSIGVLLVALMLFRFVWRYSNTKVIPLTQHKPWEKKLATLIHYLLYGLILLMLPTGYFITTAKGQGLDLFNWFTIPAVITNIDNLEDFASLCHRFIAYSIISLVGLHSVGAFKHHFVDKDKTLIRMIKPQR